MTFEISSALAEDAVSLMRRFDMAAVNDELGPWLRMTVPPAWAARPISDWPTGPMLFSSWILLLGLLPVDRHRFGLESVDAAGGFREASSSWALSSWRHERVIEATDTGMSLTDRITWRTRIPAMAVLLGPVYRSVFRHRHRRLRQRFGPAP